MLSAVSNSSSLYDSLNSATSGTMTQTLQGQSNANQQSFFSALNDASNGEAQGVDPTKNDELRKQFDKFVGGTFFRQMLTEMQKSVGKAAFMDGGHAEEMFRSELNSKLADQMAEKSGSEFTGPMFELFQLQRGN